MSTYSDDEINRALQEELISAVAKVQDAMGVQFITVDMNLNIYGKGSQVKFSIAPDEITKPLS